MIGWKKCPCVMTGGKPHFWYNRENKLWVSWSRMTESWGIFNFDEIRLMPGRSTHYKTDTAALKAADRMIAADAKKAELKSKTK